MRLCVGLCPALTEDVLSKLHKAGIENILDFMLKDTELLAKEISVSYKDLQSIRRIIHAHYAAFAVSGNDMLTEAVQTAVISTGNTNLDNLLGGGLMTGEVMEVCGGWGVGKTSLCVNLALHAALKLKMNVLYIDPLGSVNSLRIASVIEAFSEELEIVEQALACIKTVAPSDVWGIFQALELARQPYLSLKRKAVDCSGGESNSIICTVGKTKLVIVDSLPSVLMPLLGGQQKQGWGIINQLAAALKSLASEQQLAVVVVNNVVQTTFNSMKNKGYKSQSNWKPALGRFWAHVPHVRLFVETVPCSSTPHNSEKGSLSQSEINVSIWKSTRLKISSSKISIFPAL